MKSSPKGDLPKGDGVEPSCPYALDVHTSPTAKHKTDHDRIVGPPRFVPPPMRLA